MKHIPYEVNLEFFKLLIASAIIVSVIGID